MSAGLRLVPGGYPGVTFDDFVAAVVEHNTILGKLVHPTHGTYILLTTTFNNYSQRCINYSTTIQKANHIVF